MELTKISTEHPAYPFVEELWLSAFPEEERRDTEAQRQNTDKNPLFGCYLATLSDGTPAGFITYWDFDTVGYCEHFATAPHLRGKGIGAQIIAELTCRTGKPLILEVEMPEDEMSRRRIGFYSRCGLALHDEISYMQPPYRPGGTELPMLLMSSIGITKPEITAAINNIRKHVYHTI